MAETEPSPTPKNESMQSLRKLLKEKTLKELRPMAVITAQEFIDGKQPTDVDYQQELKQQLDMNIDKTLAEAVYHSLTAARNPETLERTIQDLSKNKGFELSDIEEIINEIIKKQQLKDGKP